MTVSALELVEDLQVRSGWSTREASAVVHTLERRLEATTSQLVTNDRMDARLAELRTEIAGVRTEVATATARLGATIRGQTTWFTGVIAAAVGVLIAAAGVGVAITRALM